MNKGKPQPERGAVLYVRVSTTEQAEGPLNLINQENRCRDYCKQNKLNVIAVFVDPGESARTADRPEFQNMLRFCKARRKDVGYVVVQDLSRFARNLRDLTETTESLNAIGVLVRSVYEHQVDESATGKLNGALIGSFAEYYSNALSEKQKENTRRLVGAGLFPWKAPIGYVNTKSGATIAPDSERAALITRAFELFATGQYTKAEVLLIVTGEGLRTAAGKPVTKQTFQAMLRNPLYAGWVRIASDIEFEPIKVCTSHLSLRRPLTECRPCLTVGR